MKLTIENTTKIVELNGIPARIWKGTTDTGIAVYCFITLIAIKESESPENIAQFEAELEEQRAPSKVNGMN